MTNPKSTTDERPLISRSTIVILLSYQIGMVLGSGFPTTFVAILHLMVAAGIAGYLGYGLIRHEGEQRRDRRKKERTAQVLEHRIQTHIIDPPSPTVKAPKQPRMRIDADFIPVVSDWG